MSAGRVGPPPLPPGHARDLQPRNTQTDAVVLHLWQAVQVVIDLAVSSYVRLGLGQPAYLSRCVPHTRQCETTPTRQTEHNKLPLQ